MLSEAQSRVGKARREVHRQIGDYTLFWAGLYPESLERVRKQLSKDALIDYCEQGKRAYWIASTIDSDEQDAKTRSISPTSWSDSAPSSNFALTGFAKYAPSGNGATTGRRRLRS